MESQKYGASVAGTLGMGIDTQGSEAGAALVGYWPLNEGSGSSTIDQSGNGNNGIWSGTPAGTSGYYSAGHNQAWAGTFNGSNDYVNVGSTLLSSSTSANAFTISLWANTGNAGGYFISKQNPYPQPVDIDISSSTYTATIAFQIGESGSYQTIGPPYFTFSPLYNNWEYWTFIYSGGSSPTASIYLNGHILVSPTVVTVPLAGASLPMYIGGRGGTGDFPGLISNVRIYNGALSAAEIQALYSLGK